MDLPARAPAWAEAPLHVEAAPAGGAPALDLGRLTWAYALVPLVAALVGIDALLDRSLLAGLPTAPDQLLWINLLIPHPHIVASVLLVCDRPYLARYGRSFLLLALGIALGTWAFEAAFGLKPFLLLLGLLTTQHSLGQQLGLVRSQLRSAPLIFGVWKWSTLLLANVCYAYVYRGTLGWSVDPRAIVAAAALLLLVSSGAGFAVLRATPSTSGRAFAAANQGLVVVIVLTTLTDHPFWAILLPRLLHDVTAFAAYVVHDLSRHGAAPQNAVHRFARFVGLPTAFVSPVFGVALALPLTLFAAQGVGNAVAVCLTLWHYAIETFVWRRPSPLRRHLVIR